MLRNSYGAEMARAESLHRYRDDLINLVESGEAMKMGRSYRFNASNMAIQNKKPEIKLRFEERKKSRVCK